MGEPVRLVQREEGLGLCERACARVRSGGAVVVFEGGPGFGKSAMLEAAAQIAESQGVEVLRAAGSEFERDFSYGVVGQLFDAVPGFVEPAPGQPEHSVDHALLQLLAGFARARPVMLAVDDLTLVDEGSLSFLRHLAARHRDHPIVLVASLDAARLGSRVPASVLSIQRDASVHPLAPLDPAGLRELLASAGRASDDGEQLARLTAGNPFLVTNMIGWRGGVSLPPAIVRDVALRLAAVPPTARRLAEATAVLGDDVSVTVAARTMGVRPAAALDALDALAAVGLMRRSGMLTFSARLLRTAVYSLIGRAEQNRLHRRAARALWLAEEPVTEAAEHLLASDGGGETWAIEILREAAAQAPDRASARGYLRHALSEDPPAELRARVLAELAGTELSGGDSDAARHLRKAVDLLDAGPERAAAREHLARVLWALGRYSDAGEQFVAGLDEMEGHGGAVAARLSVGCIAARRVLADAGPDGPARRPVPMLETAPEAPVTAASRALELLLAGGAGSRVAGIARLALRDGRLLREQTCGGPAYQAAICALLWTDELEAAEEAATAAIEETEKVAREPALGVMLLMRAFARFRRGDLCDSLADARAATARVPAQLPVPLPSPEALAARLELELGAPRSGRESARRALARDGGRVEHALALAARAEVEMATGSPQLALVDLKECGSLLSEAAVESPAIADWRCGAAHAACRMGERDRALRLAAEYRESAEAFGTPRALGRGLIASAASHASKERLDELRGAVAVLEDCPGRLDLAHGLAELGTELRRRGSRRAAREALRRALDLALRCGAEPLARRARQDLLATGARPRRARISGVGSLTPRERQIAELAAHGQSNRAIADHLIVSEKTIEWHLANAYRKLEIRSRSGLPDSLTGA
jgi:DNA-binding CsgD family transcriptional regulator